MGGCLSSVSGAPKQVIEFVDGNEDEYHKRYLEGQSLGEGQFGVVKMVHDVTSTQDGKPLACKILRKGAILKDNVFYGPIKSEVLKGEIDILRTLAGLHYCLRFHGIYESPRALYMITDYCGGGQMMEYVSKLQVDLTSEDVSRVSFQLLSALNHCCKHHVIHRDIKPENIMFHDPSPGSDLQLIDFGSGVIDRKEKSPYSCGEDKLYQHSTFAGSAFYISPEMFQHNYDARTDVWSAGVALYVLVAGYPADCLQSVFNVLHKRNRNLQTDLPHMPENMPDMFFDLLNKLLVYNKTKRVTAGALLDHKFVTFHMHIQDDEEYDEPVLTIEDIAAAAVAAGKDDEQKQQSSLRASMKKHGSVSLRGSVVRHQYFLGFKNFERSLTTLLAVMLPKHDLDRLLEEISNHTSNNYIVNKKNEKNNPNSDNKEIRQQPEDDDDNDDEPSGQQILSVCKVSELKDVIKTKIQNESVLESIAKLPNSESYNNFAYHIELLVVFSSFEIAQTIAAADLSIGSNASGGGGERRMQLHKRGSFRRVNSLSARVSGNALFMSGSNNSTKSSSSVRAGGRFGGRRTLNPNGSNKGGTVFNTDDTNYNRKNNSVQGSNVFASLSKRRLQKLHEDTSTRST